MKMASGATPDLRRRSRLRRGLRLHGYGLVISAGLFLFLQALDEVQHRW